MTNRMQREVWRLFNTGRSIAGIADLLSADPFQRRVTPEQVEEAIQRRMKRR